MTRVKRVVAAVAMSVALLGGSASAASASDFGTLACENPTSSSTWCHGTQVGTAGLKNCYSNYVHQNNYHSSTAIMGGATSKRYASAGNWSNASVTGGWAYTCYTYYNPSA